MTREKRSVVWMKNCEQLRLYDSNLLSLWGISDRRLRSTLPSKFSGICCPLFFLALWVGGLENYLFFSIFIYIDVFRICQLSMMERLAKINHSFQSLIIFSKRSPSNVWQWPKYVPFIYFQPFNDFLMSTPCDIVFLIYVAKLSNKTVIVILASKCIDSGPFQTFKLYVKLVNGF